ncbi:helix-turn-helix domain-containing protein [Roseibium sediminis]|uniref:helix-turn-helix domain-containing protein n=1 Tax=Roseibium sediminis TaxID=1775174 RepID=UPI00123DD0E2|nr:helix-turn-helix transcriptional regulator [Roseibium sediminis]
MKLSDYLATEGQSHAQFGERVGVSQAAINRYANGERIPRAEIMAKIEEVTGGQVTAVDHYAAKSEAAATKATSHSQAA